MCVYIYKFVNCLRLIFYLVGSSLPSFSYSSSSSSSLPPPSTCPSSSPTSLPLCPTSRYFPTSSPAIYSPLFTFADEQACLRIVISHQGPRQTAPVEARYGGQQINFSLTEAVGTLPAYTLYPCCFLNLNFLLCPCVSLCFQGLR